MSIYKTNGLPWQAGRFAVNVADCKTAREVIESAGLDWTVKKCELVAKMPFGLDMKPVVEGDEGFFSYGGKMFRDCPNAFATYRTDYNIPLGIVKSKYEVVQNSAAFTFFDDAIGKDKAIWQTAGSFGNGERIFVTAKLPDTIQVANDQINNYLVFTSSHDGSTGITILFTPIRVICENTLNAALRTTECYIRFRHTSSVHERLGGAAELLGITKKQTELTQELYNHLYSIKMTDDEVMNFMAKLFLTDAEYCNLQEYDSKKGIEKLMLHDYRTMEVSKVSTRKANQLTAAWEYYMDGIGQKQIAGTAWGAYNAITGYYSNVANLEGERRMDSLLYGGANRIMIKAINSVAEEVAA